MKRPATNIAKYVPAAKPLTGNTPATDDQGLRSTWSHGLPPLHPITDPPVT
jgi:hypothetical protein